MSLINKMLQDLDARGGQPGPAAVSPEIKPVLPAERGFPWLRAALIAALVLVLGASAYVAWRIQRTSAVEVPVEVAQAPAATPAAMPATVRTPLPPPPPPPTPVPAPVAAAPAVAAPVEAARPAAEAGRAAVPASAPELASRKTERKAQAATEAPRPTAAPSKAAASDEYKTGSAGRSETALQRADNAYRRALAALEDGRVTEAIGHLEEALRANGRHDAARQTLVSLLIEARRPEEAMRQLGAALALDARQPAMAMLLARLQLERGSPGIDTLMRTLPYAKGNGEYHAFLAGALQREERHAEAAEHYTAALRTAPQNGVWWMGLGISLQAEKRITEAADAYQKALASGTLSPELRGFVERKLKQLAR